MTLGWYVVHTYSGCEQKVKTTLEEQLDRLGLRDKVGKIMIPTEDIIEIRGGAKKISSRKRYPGYIFIQMDMDEDMWYMVKNIPKVTGFLGGKNKPTPISEEEVNQLIEQLKSDTAKPKPKVMYVHGENVRVVDGPFTNFNGVIEDVNPDKGKIRVIVSIFGRSTPVELEFTQVEKV
ncbi:MAG: transcription termination/antitermination protein NusG [Nitrospinae bacterium]|jgi:transcriptional antiterminator NusG|nr:transcription termination/antitermination protein NusG [Nitrospinota bacterium]HJN02558.1 transcription termination/antitermination protein NusG [Nitrospinota bacterium]|tara:strand:+ start:466 stop:996 length:531 start_codon:yes stop_codon:yes gene_type:complete